MKIVHDLTVHQVNDAPPFVRVHAHFIEGGTQSRSHNATNMCFLVDRHEQPKVGQELRLTIETAP